MKTKEYLHVNKIEIPIYRGVLTIVLSNSVKKVKSLIPVYSNEYVYASCYSRHSQEQGSYYIILNLDSDFRKLHHGTISHECLHAVNMIFNDRGVLPDHKNDEAAAYFLEWMVDEIYHFIDEKGMMDKLTHTD